MVRNRQRRQASARRLFVACLACLLVGACGTPGRLVADQLDPLTGVTATRATVPLVLYRDESGLAAHARDYVYLGPIEINRMGNYRYYLWLGIWSTVQDHDISAQRDGFESIVVFVDGEPLALELAGWTPEAIGLSEPLYPKPVASAADAYYAVTLDQVRLIARAADIRLQGSGFDNASYEPWDKQASAIQSLQAFVDEVSY